MEVQWSSFYRLTDDNVEDNVPVAAGVYLLTLKLKSGDWRYFYAGKALDLRERLTYHVSESEDNPCIKKHVKNHVCGFYYAKVPRKTDRAGIEKFLYDELDPECNQVDPGGEPIPVNLPD